MPDGPDHPAGDEGEPRPPTGPIAAGPLPHLRSRPKTVEDLAARLAANHHGGSRPPHPPVAWAKVIVGLGMMIGAVVWFVAGWENGTIYFYPPVLLGLGFVAILKGLLGHRDG